MDETVLFTERQRFNQAWIWIILLGVDGVLIFDIYKQILSGQSQGDASGSIQWLIPVILVLAVNILFIFLRLETRITTTGISVRFFPFHLKYRNYPWNIISEVFVRKYNPLLEYGGWGLRFGFRAKGPAYNVSGDKGIQLTFTNGSKLLIGTQKAEEVMKILAQVRNEG